MAEQQIVFPLYPGVTQLSFTGPLQVFSRLPGVKVVMASMGGLDIKGDGLTFTGLAELERVERCDLICVPGGMATVEAMLDEAYMAQIRRLAAGATYVTSVCSGSMILAGAGLLTGKRATGHWALRELLALFGAIPDGRRVVRDGDVITAGGVTAGLDFALLVAAELCGEMTAQALQLGMEYAPEPPFSAGRPETAPADVLVAVQLLFDARKNVRMAGLQEAVRRLQRV